MRLLLLTLLFPALILADDGKLSTEASTASIEITVIIPPRAEVQKDATVITNLLDSVITKEGTTLVIFPSSN